MPNKMRLFIADANPEFRLALQMFLHQEPGMDVVGLAVHSNELIAQIAASKPDVLLIDWQLPDRPVPEMVAELRALKLPINIIVICVRPEEEIPDGDFGADVFIGMSHSPDELMNCLRKLRDRC